MGLLEKSVLLELFLFLTPGIIVVYLLNLVRIGPRLEYRFLILHYVVAATFFYILFYPVFHFGEGVVLPVWLHSFLFFFVTPSALGLLLAYSSKFSLFEKALQKVEFKANVPIDDAWDYLFGEKLGDGVYVIITLKTDDIIYGYIGPSSLAGNTPGRRDLFVERIFELADNEEWVAVQPNRAIYLKEDQIRFMEILDA